jgi:hypothetical protein
MQKLTVLGAFTALLFLGTATAAPEGPTTAPEKIAVIAEAPAEASVTDVKWIESAENGAKIYSTAGGDPAINGLYTFLAIPSDEPGGGWHVFEIGNFNEWKIAEETKDHVILAVSRSWVEQSSGDIKTVEEKLNVPLVGPEATEITVTPVK